MPIDYSRWDNLDDDDEDDEPAPARVVREMPRDVPREQLAAAAAGSWARLLEEEERRRTAPDAVALDAALRARRSAAGRNTMGAGPCMQRPRGATSCVSHSTPNASMSDGAWRGGCRASVPIWLRQGYFSASLPDASVRM